MYRRKSDEAVRRFEERRKLENDAPRLRDEIATLQSLRLEFVEYDKEGGSPRARYTRHVVVDRAAALFVIPCGERDCDGGHDVTRAMMRMLAMSKEEFEGQDECLGVRSGSTCHHNLRYSAHARYGTMAPSE